MFFGFTLLVVLLYHTAAMLLACVLASLLIFRLIDRSDRLESYSAATLVTALVGIVAYFAYVSLTYFQLFARTLQSVPSALEYLVRGEGTQPRDSLLRDLLSTDTSPAFVVPLVISAILIAWPVFLVIGSGLLRWGREPVGDPRRVVVPWLLGLGPFAIGLYLWSGVLGVMWKAGEFGSVFSMVAAASILASPFRAIIRKLLYLSIVVAVVLATYIYVTYESTGPNDLSISEHEAGTWLANVRLPKRSCSPTCDLPHR